MIFQRIRKSFKDAVSEHYGSVIMFLVATVLWAIDYDFPSTIKLNAFLPVIVETLMGTALGVLLCEAIHLYKGKEITRRGRILYGVIVLAAFLISLFYSFMISGISYKQYFRDNLQTLKQISTNLFICCLVTLLALTIFFFYKRSGESFETYTAKAFCGLMKAELVYGIIALGLLLIMLAVDVLIFDVSDIELIARTQIILLGLVEFPCALIGLSKTEGSVSKFGKIVLNYVFTVLLMAAFAIIYIYIIKILFTWSFPKNEVFSILTMLFAFGVLIWTMAQGVCPDNLRKAMDILPLLYIPFIVLQVMCLYMRVKDYGFTFSRYMGLFVILFELVYFGIYLVRTYKGKDIMGAVLFVVIASAFITLLIPGVNAYSVVTMSQKGKIERYLQKGEKATKAEKHDAFEAYKELRDEGGISGNRYLQKKLTKEQRDGFENKETGTYTDSALKYYINVHKEREIVDVAGYDFLQFIAVDVDRADYEPNLDVTNLEITSRDEETVVGTVDVSDLVKALISNYEDDLDQSYSDMLIEKPIVTNEGDTLIITYIHIYGYKGDDLDIRNIEIDGYLLK